MTLYTNSLPSRQLHVNNVNVNNRNTGLSCKISSKLTINTPERSQRRLSGVFIVNFEHISHVVLMFLLLILSR